MSSTQAVIPIVRAKTQTVLGTLILGAGYTTFDGTETTATLLSNSQTCPIQRYYPGGDRSTRKPWYMAYVVDEDTYRSNSWRLFVDFNDTNSYNVVARIQSPTSMPNTITELDNTLLDIISGPRVDPSNVPSTQTVAFSTSISGSTVTLTNSSTGYTSCDVNWGDGTTSVAIGTTATHTYSSFGTKTILLTAHLDQALDKTVSHTASVVPTASPNPATILGVTHGEGFTALVTTVTGAVPSSVSATTGSVPAGTALSIQGQNIALSGTVADAGSISFTITIVTDSGNIVVPVTGTVA